jgi:hypothetical protein
LGMGACWLRKQKRQRDSAQHLGAGCYPSRGRVTYRSHLLPLGVVGQEKERAVCFDVAALL